MIDIFIILSLFLMFLYFCFKSTSKARNYILICIMLLTILHGERNKLISRETTLNSEQNKLNENNLIASIREQYKDDDLKWLDNLDMTSVHFLQLDEDADYEIAILDRNSEVEEENFIIFNTNNNQYEILFRGTNIEQYFLPSDNRFIVMETKSSGIGTGVFGSEYLIYTYDDSIFEMVWSENKYMIHSKNDTDIIYKVIGKIDLIGNKLEYTYINLTTNSSGEYVNYQEYIDIYEFKDNNFELIDSKENI
ncbi:hypothetical protein [Proteiniborus sp. MB09-C3]|uniref:hypothetical protein n=1 Tax=Proteiniborus sp. MB09-C3 TaxID=3050072 RepID=UPI00255500AD|nr:hypothetical protein [Proteiniborus sp. MB09-C3]WIV13383.1 hypothetical protein QO263_06670 [Proteiniborus sp. MB09-C3]